MQKVLAHKEVLQQNLEAKAKITQAAMQGALQVRQDSAVSARRHMHTHAAAGSFMLLLVLLLVLAASSAVVGPEQHVVTAAPAHVLKLLPL